MVAKMPFDWQTDLALLTLVVRVPEVLVVHPSLPAQSLQELVAYARANPRKISYGSAGTGSISDVGCLITGNGCRASNSAAPSQAGA